MRHKLRIILVGVMIFSVSLNPASAWFMFGGGCGGFAGYRGYCNYGGYGAYNSYAPVYYTSYCYGPSYCGSRGCNDWAYETCYSDCCASACSSCSTCCGSGAVVYDSSGMSGDCASCGSEVVVDHGVSEMPAGEATSVPMESHSVPTPQVPAEVQRPAEPAETTPIPSLPPEPAPSTPEATQPTVQPTPPAEQPVPPADDLFGPESAPAATTTPPAEAVPPADTSNMDELFGTPSTEAAPPAGSTPPAEPVDADLFGTGSTGPAEGTMPPAESTPAGTEPMPPAEAAPAGDESTDDTLDIFNSSHDVLREPGGLASNELRQWTDNTGKFSCQGRLIRFVDGKVRLLKDNGRTTTVALSRLSSNDLEFVNRQASAQETDAVGRIAQSMTMMSLIAN